MSDNKKQSNTDKLCRFIKIVTVDIFFIIGKTPGVNYDFMPWAIA